MRALWLADVLRAAGLKVIETPGWRERGRGDLLVLRGAPDSLQGVVCHHTASPRWSTLNTNLMVVTTGTNGTPGPIAQLLLWRDGTFYVIASGKANHAGAGGPIGSWLPLSPPGTLSIANDRTLGIEAVNDGLGETWPDEMLDAYETGVAAILAHLDLPAERAITHAEWAPTRKIDPAGPTGGRIAMLPRSMTWDPFAWRSRIHDRMAPAPVDDQEEDPMLGAKTTTARLWRDARYKNGWLIGAGPALHLSQRTWDEYVEAGVPIVLQEEAHEQMLTAVLTQSGLDRSHLVKA